MSNKKVRLAINGFGRIGRSSLRRVYDAYGDAIEIVAINDLGDLNNLAYLLKYDSAQGTSDLDISASDDGKHLFVNGDDILVYQEKDPAQLPWKEQNVDVVIESTGFFREYDKAKLHLDAGAKKVVISAPAKGEPVEGISSGTILMGINSDHLSDGSVSSNGSCTTNAASPLISILNDTIGVKKALLNTTHGYTSTQSIVDGSVRGSDYRKGRAAAQNIVPTSTGAAIAVTKALPELAGKFDGIACRVPVVSGSIADVTFLSKRDTTVEEVNNILREASKQAPWKGVFTVTEEPMVSSDIIGNPHGSIADLAMTRVVDGNLVKVMAWYDNEMGYTNTLLQHVVTTAQTL